MHVPTGMRLTIGDHQAAVVAKGRFETAQGLVAMRELVIGVRNQYSIDRIGRNAGDASPTRRDDRLRTDSNARGGICMKQIVSRLLDRDPAIRYNCAAEVMRDLMRRRPEDVPPQVDVRQSLAAVGVLVALLASLVGHC